MKNLETYLAEISQNAFFCRVRRDEIDYWGDDIPITVLFGGFGRQIAKNFSNLSPKERSCIFSLIENGMKEGDELLRTVLATGLLEALYGQISKDPDLMSAVMNHLGESSKDYLVEWISWKG